MTPLPVPTDNLYKFCAITGVVLIVLSSYAAWQRFDELSKREIALEIALKRNDIDKAFVDIDAELAKSDLENSKLENDRNNFEERSRLLKDKIAKGFADTKAGWKDAEQNVATAKELLLLNSELKVTAWVGGVGCLFGMIIGGYGFYNWRRLQLLQDSVLTKQLDEGGP
jgi:hypothetical protein